MMIFKYILLFFVPVTGGIVALTAKTVNEKSINLLLAFSGAYLFSITIAHLLPELYSENAPPEISIYILSGFLLQILLDTLSKGVEHGHMHLPASVSHSYIWSIMTGLSIHAFFEGIPLIDSPVTNHVSGNPLLYGILIHKLPAAIALTSILIQSGIKRSYVFLLLTVFSLMSPLGLFFGEYISQSKSINILMAFVIGSFLHISTTILFESSTKIHKFSLIKLLVIIAGMVIALFTINH